MIFAIAAALLTAVLLYMLLFEDWDDFLECVKFWLMPDIISMFRGKYWEDAWAELKLYGWALVSGWAHWCITTSVSRKQSSLHGMAHTDCAAAKTTGGNGW